MSGKAWKGGTFGDLVQEMRQVPHGEKRLVWSALAAAVREYNQKRPRFKVGCSGTFTIRRTRSDW